MPRVYAFFSNAFSSWYSQRPPSAWIMDRFIHKSRPWRERRPPSILGDNNNLSITGSIGRIIKIGALRGKIDFMQIASLFEPDIIGYHKYFPFVYSLPHAFV